MFSPIAQSDDVAKSWPQEACLQSTLVKPTPKINFKLIDELIN
jgi:hypothetical protein